MWREPGFTLKQTTSKPEWGKEGQTMTSSLPVVTICMCCIKGCSNGICSRWTTCTLAYFWPCRPCHPSIWQTTTVTVAIDTVKLSSACAAIVCSWYMVARGHGSNHNATDFECKVKDSQRSITYIYIDIIILTNYLFYFGHWEERKETILIPCNFLYNKWLNKYLAKNEE